MIVVGTGEQGLEVLEEDAVFEKDRVFNPNLDQVSLCFVFFFVFLCPSFLSIQIQSDNTCKVSRKRKDPSLLPRGTRQKVELDRSCS